MMREYRRLACLFGALAFLWLAFGPHSWLGESFGQGQITCYFEKDNYQIAENGKTLSIKVFLSAASKDPCSVFVKTQQVTATAQVDYGAFGEAGQAAKVLTFASGTTEQILTIDIIDDAYIEGN